MKYGIISDIHAHSWSQFATVNPDGVNNRLRLILNEVERAAATVIAEGGSTLFCAGDVFHTRGSIDPEVLNPVRETIERVLGMGIDIYVIAGNHDLKSQDTRKLSSAIQNLEQMHPAGGSLVVINEPKILRIQGGMFAFAPWRNDTAALLADLRTLADSDPFSCQAHLFIHAGIDGVLSGMPAHGLTAAQLASYGFERVFAGHYHNHANMGDGVYSIGATTHHTWGDIGTRAGFLTVEYETGAVTFNDTRAPKFVDISGMDEADMQLEAAGNYTRFRGPAMTQENVNELRDQLKRWGALGVSIEVPRAITAARPTAHAAGLTLEQSVEAYVDAKTDLPAHVDKEAVKKRAAEVLAATKAVVEEA